MRPLRAYCGPSSPGGAPMARLRDCPKTGRPPLPRTTLCTTGTESYRCWIQINRCMRTKKRISMTFWRNCGIFTILVIPLWSTIAICYGLFTRRALNPASTRTIFSGEKSMTPASIRTRKMRSTAFGSGQGFESPCHGRKT